MPTTEIYDEAPDKAFYALDDLCDELDELDNAQKIIEKILDLESGGVEKRISTVKERLIEFGATIVEPLTGYLHNPDSYGYRPGRSAHQAVAKTRERCWRFRWVVDLDIKAFFGTYKEACVKADEILLRP